jgi:integrase
MRLANRMLAVSRKFFDWCIDEDLLSASPCDRVKNPAAEVSRERVLSDRELALVLAAADACGFPAAPLIRLLVLTGLRRGEIGNLRWSEINIESATMTIPAARAKIGRSYEVPLSKVALEILIGVPIRFGPALFTSLPVFPSSSFAAIKSKIDAAMPEPLPGWTLHDLRRTCATGLARLGTPPHIVEKDLHHASGTFGGIAGVYQRYDFSGEVRAALDAWAEHVKGLK